MTTNMHPIYVAIVTMILVIMIIYLLIRQHLYRRYIIRKQRGEKHEKLSLIEKLFGEDGHNGPLGLGDYGFDEK